MAIAQLIFTGYGWFRLFWAAFDLALIFLALKVAIELEKLVFGHFKKLITYGHLMGTCLIHFFKCPKINFP